MPDASDSVARGASNLWLIKVASFVEEGGEPLLKRSATALGVAAAGVPLIPPPPTPPPMPPMPPIPPLADWNQCRWPPPLPPPTGPILPMPTCAAAFQSVGYPLPVGVASTLCTCRGVSAEPLVVRCRPCPIPPPGVGGNEEEAAVGGVAAGGVKAGGDSVAPTPPPSREGAGPRPKSPAKSAASWSNSAAVVAWEGAGA